jgi:hypothetical protein
MHQLKCPESEHDPHPTLNELDLLIADHASAGGTLADSEKKNIVLHLLPSSWRNNIWTILANTESIRQFSIQINPSGARALYTADTLVKAIRSLARNDAAINGTTTPSGGAALAASSRDVCNNCGHKGHWAKDCWSKGGGKEGQHPANWKEMARGNRNGGGGGGGGNSGRGGGGGSNNNNTAKAADAGTGNYLFAFSAAAHVTTNFKKLEETGIVLHGFTALLDSGANCHYCPSHEHFIEYHTINADSIRSAPSTPSGAARSPLPSFTMADAST